jgi:hypothetical protein
MFACDESTNNRTPVGEMSDIMHFRTENPSSGRIQAGEPILRRGALRAPCAIAVTPIVPAALKQPSVNRPSSRALFYRRKLWAILIRFRKFELLRSQFGNHKFPKRARTAAHPSCVNKAAAIRICVLLAAACTR